MQQQLEKVQKHVYGLKKSDFKTQLGTMEFIILRPLVA